MSEIQIVVDRNNVDHNGLRDIAAAVAEAGAVSSVDVDEDHHVLTATLPAAEVHTVAAMEGVRYVRNVLTYYWAA